MTDYTEAYAQAAEGGKLLAQYSPAAGKKLKELAGAVLQDGAIDVKTKELVAVGIAVAIRCDNCIMGHVKNALAAGVTMEELAEVVDVAIMMGGGPSSAYGGKALSVAQFLLDQK